MSLASLVARSRAATESRMDSVCKVYYESARGTLNPSTGIQTPTYTNRATGVPCRISAQRQIRAKETSPAQMLASTIVRDISVPVSTPEVFAGDFVELTTVGPLTDPTVAGVRFRVVDPGEYSQGTARRMKVEVDL